MRRIVTIITMMMAVSASAQHKLSVLKISPNGRFFQTQDGKPFFWLGDTGWLLFSKCSREEAIQYLETRRKQEFNVVQVMVIHELHVKNVYGDSALINRNLAKPDTSSQQNFWNHVDFIINEAEKRGIYMAMVPVWGSNIKEGKVNTAQAGQFAKFLANRYKSKSNIIWLNGGDINGNDGIDVWKEIGTTLNKIDKNHLIGYHPRGRHSSSEWFHNESWMDFNMFQSGHRTYAQDTSSNEKLHYGEDNWKYVNTDYALKPIKPTMDGEPSYENIPHGLHDSLQPRWKDADLRRYAYWSVFAGGAGFTYGENAVMQFHTPGDKDANYGVNSNWKHTINAPGATQMKYLKALMLSKPYLERRPAQDIIARNVQGKYNYVLGTKGKNYAMAYTYTGSNIHIDFSKLGFSPVQASWFNPRDGKSIALENFKKTGIIEFNPPGEPAEGHDWVLVIER